REAPLALVAMRRGIYSAALDHDAHAALGEGWAQALPCEFAPDADRWFEAALDAGIAAYWLFDLGRGYAGQGWVEVAGASGGERIAISYIDKLNDEAEPVISDPQTYCRVRMTDRFRLREGDQSAESFGLRGGRFLLFQVTGPAGAALRMRFHARVSEYPL